MKQVIYRYEYELTGRRRTGEVYIVNPETDDPLACTKIAEAEIARVHKDRPFFIIGQKRLESESGVFHDWGWF